MFIFVLFVCCYKILLKASFTFFGVVGSRMCLLEYLRKVSKFLACSVKSMYDFLWGHYRSIDHHNTFQNLLVVPKQTEATFIL